MTTTIKHTTDRFGFQCRACDELIEQYESEGMTTSDAQGCAGADHSNANRERLAAQPARPIMKIVALLLVALTFGGCTLCREHPMACTIGGAIIVGSIAASIDHDGDNSQTSRSITPHRGVCAPQGSAACGP